ncbi:MAG: hypothetical protein N2652_06295 [Kiritimatiellae bacterium]|nr:hypothetical protein [Kiritimatiellia bacterium]
MAKVLRVLVVLLVLMGGAAVVLEYQLFTRRQELKRSVQTLERSAMELAETLSAAREPYIEAIDQKVNRTALMQSTEMGRQLRVIETLAENRYDQLFSARDDLKRTTDELNQTKADLAKTRQDLESARREIVSLREQISQKEAELAELQRKIGELEGRVAELNKTIEQNKNRIAQIENEKADLKDEVQRLEVELARYLNDPNIVKQMPRGLAGNVVAVNTEWNFVVLDIGSRDGLVKDAHMLVHRSDELVGKVRIMQASEHWAIADIERDWQLSPIREGDRVLY